MKIHIWIVITLIVVPTVFVLSDPCTNFKPLNDSTLLTTYALKTGDTIPSLPTSAGWYRYVTTTEGLISTVCPTEKQCGSDIQVWINGTLPSTAGTAKNMTLCRREGKQCCRSGNSMEVKWCTNFLVFYLRPLGKARLCFQNTTSSKDPLTISTPTILTTTSSEAPSAFLSGFDIVLFLTCFFFLEMFLQK